MKKTIAAMCIALAGLCACERGDPTPRGIRGPARTQQQPMSQQQASTQEEPSKDLTGADRGVLRLERAAPGTGPASAPLAHATASDPTGAQQVYNGMNADTFDLHGSPPTAIGGGPPSEPVESEGAAGDAR